MQIFSLFFKTVRNHLPVLAIYTIAFLAISVLMTSSMKTDEESRFQAEKLNISVADEDHSAASEALTEYLSRRHHVTETTADSEQNYDDLFYRYVDYILTIPAGFQTTLVSGTASGSLVTGQALPSSAGAVFVDSQISGFISAVKMRLAAGGSVENAVSTALEDAAALPGVQTLSSDNAGAAEGETLPIWYYFRYLPYVLINLLVLGLGTVLAGVKDAGFQIRLQVSPVKPAAFRMRLYLAGIVYALFIWAVFFAASQALYGGESSGKALLLAGLNTLTFTLVSLSIAVFASSLAGGSRRSRTATLNMFSNTISLAMSFFCGIFVPLEFLGKGVKTLAHFLPAYWYVRLNNALSANDAALTGSMVSFASKCILIQLAFTAGFLIAGAVLEKKKSPGGYHRSSERGCHSR